MSRRIKSDGEQDAYTDWRHVLSYLQRPGIVKKIKRATHKRERRQAQRAAADELTRMRYEEGL